LFVLLLLDCSRLGSCLGIEMLSILGPYVRPTKTDMGHPLPDLKRFVCTSLDGPDCPVVNGPRANPVQSLLNVLKDKVKDLFKKAKVSGDSESAPDQEMSATEVSVTTDESDAGVVDSNTQQQISLESILTGETKAKLAQQIQQMFGTESQNVKIRAFTLNSDGTMSSFNFNDLGSDGVAETQSDVTSDGTVEGVEGAAEGTGAEDVEGAAEGTTEEAAVMNALSGLDPQIVENALRNALEGIDIDWIEESEESEPGTEVEEKKPKNTAWVSVIPLSPTQQTKPQRKPSTSNSVPDQSPASSFAQFSSFSPSPNTNTDRKKNTNQKPIKNILP